MKTEIEKKYRLTVEQREFVLKKLREIRAVFESEDFEENILFGGGLLSLKSCVLRLRKTEKKAVLTYKTAAATESAVKRRTEYETEVGDAETLLKIFENLGYKPGLIYEKRRQTWHYENVEIVIDELPFGSFMEIEGEEGEILKIETKFEIVDLTAIHESYPALTIRHGAQRGDVVEARFE